MKSTSHTPMNRRTFLKSSALAIISSHARSNSSAGLALPASRTTRPKNVLFVIADDLNRRLNCYGYPVVQSPNIDRLAAVGMRFDSAYCQYPLCNPSRSSFLTGLRPDSVGVLEGQTWFRDKLPKVVTLPQLFKERGYATAHVGKVFHDARSTPDDPFAWDVAVVTKRTKRGGEGRFRNLTPGSPIALSLLESEGNDEDHIDGQIAREAIHLLEQYRNQPFFLGIGFTMPHIPWVFPKRYFDLYSKEAIDLPRTVPDDSSDIPEAARKKEGFDYRMDEETWREAIRAYYAGISFMDAQLGKLLQALKRLNLMDSTVIVFIGDNGWHLGEHGLWHKFSLFEQSVGVPLIIVTPGIKNRGKATAGLVELVDIYPTLTELCGLEAPHGLEGTSLLPLLDNPGRPWKKAAFSQTVRGGITGRSIRTERFRYNEWDGGKAGLELYDHQMDPDEFINRVHDPQYSVERRELQRLLRGSGVGPRLLGE